MNDNRRQELEGIRTSVGDINSQVRQIRVAMALSCDEGENLDTVKLDAVRASLSTVTDLLNDVLA